LKALITGATIVTKTKLTFSTTNTSGLSTTHGDDDSNDNDLGGVMIIGTMIDVWKEADVMMRCRYQYCYTRSALLYVPVRKMNHNSKVKILYEPLINSEYQNSPGSTDVTQTSKRALSLFALRFVFPPHHGASTFVEVECVLLLSDWHKKKTA
jgi:hypothetical protein